MAADPTIEAALALIGSASGRAPVRSRRSPATPEERSLPRSSPVAVRSPGRSPNERGSRPRGISNSANGSGPDGPQPPVGQPRTRSRALARPCRPDRDRSLFGRRGEQRRRVHSRDGGRPRCRKAGTRSGRSSAAEDSIVTRPRHGSTPRSPPRSAWSSG